MQEPPKEVKMFYDFQLKMMESPLGNDGEPTEMSDHVAIIQMLNSHARLISSLQHTIKEQGKRISVLEAWQKQADEETDILFNPTPNV